jgi:hypothetical protein
VSKSKANIEKTITELENRLATIDAEQAQIAPELDVLRGQLRQETERTESRQAFPDAPVTNSSSADAKIALIRKPAQRLGRPLLRLTLSLSVG